MSWYSIREASEKLKVSVRTLRRMIQAGTLQSRIEKGLRLVYLASDDKSDLEKGPVPISPNLLSTLFEIHEDLSNLAERCYERIEIEKEFGPLFNPFFDHKGWRPTARCWARLYLRIKGCYDPIEHLVQSLKVDPGVLQTTYREMLRVQKTWVSFIPRVDDHDSSEQTYTLDRTGEDITNNIIAKLKVLLIGCMKTP